MLVCYARELKDSFSDYAEEVGQSARYKALHSPPLPPPSRRYSLLAITFLSFLLSRNCHYSFMYIFNN